MAGILNNGLSTSSDNHQSMDVLLQLTLPIVLILALLVTGWLGELHQARKDLQGTSTDSLLKELDYTILSLQRQLLLRATDLVMESEIESIDASSYKHFAPSASDILGGRIDSEYKRISLEIFSRIGEQNKQDDYRDRLITAIEKKYRELTKEFLDKHSTLSISRRKKLRKISDENKGHYIRKLNGYLEGLKEETINVQYEIALRWIDEEKVTEIVEEKSNNIWLKLQKENDRHNDLNAFDNILINFLERTMAEEGAPLLPRTIDILRK